MELTLRSPLTLDLLNEKGLWEFYLLIIQTGTAALLEFPERKESLLNDWREENGEENDLSLVRFKDKQIDLQCVIIADSDVQFWDCYDRFFADMSTPGLKQLYIDDHSKTYDCYYLKSGNFKKVLKRLKNVEKVLVKFTITLKVKY